MKELGTKILTFAKNKAMGIPQDIVKSTQAATNISPPVDLYRRLKTNKAYRPYGGVPFSEQKKFAVDNLKDAKQGSNLISYAAPMRFLRPNAPKLSNGEQLIRSGTNWKKFDKILNK